MIKKIISQTKSKSFVDIIKGLVISEWSFFLLCIFIYLGIRLWRLEDFPINFFTDEVYYPNIAHRLLGLTNEEKLKSLITFYHQAAPGRWVPLFVSYVYMLPIELFGKSIIVVRATSAVISALVPISIALTLKYVYKIKHWWLSVLLVSFIPTWFFHSRTGFEVVMSVSFYSGFLMFYMFYRYKNSLFILPATLLAMMAFYSYTNAQLVIGITVILLGIFDFRYHIKHKWVALFAVLFGLFLFYPAYHFQSINPDGFSRTLKTIGSYVYKPNLTITQKIFSYIDLYMHGLSPQYWVYGYAKDLERHLFMPFGLIRVEQFYLFLIGMVVYIFNLNKSKYRIPILFMVVTPASSALIHIGITGVMFFLVPFALIASVGLAFLISKLPKNKIGQIGVGLIALLFVTANIHILRLALKEANGWYLDYGFYGLQWGAKQIFTQEIPKYLSSNPKDTVNIGADWANASERFVEFFAKDNKKIVANSAISLALKKTVINPNDVYVVTVSEYGYLVNSKKFKNIAPIVTINYPNNKPGFYFIKPQYVDNVDAIFESARLALLAPTSEKIKFKDQLINTTHTRLDMGSILALFDGNLDEGNLVRLSGANPAFIDLDFPSPISFTKILTKTPYSDISFKVIIIVKDNPIPTIIESKFSDNKIGLSREIVSKSFVNVSKIHLEYYVKTGLPAEDVKIHINEITIK